MIRSTAHTARKPHLCCDCNYSGGKPAIQPGDRYLSMVASPDHDDLGNRHWWRLKECAECAERHGRGHLLAGEPLTGGEG